MIFVDGISITQRFRRGQIKELAGVRRIAFRQAGDVNREGQIVAEDEVIGESFTSAWIQGSHDTKLQLRSDGTTLSLKGNPGRFGRGDNLFNLDLAATIHRCNEIVAAQGFPETSFHGGQKDPFTVGQLAKMNLAKDEVPEDPWTGSRVWSIHLTQNYATGAGNAKPIIDWLNTQTMARVKKSRLGATTVVWGSIKYCQVEVYEKAAEMLAHCKGPEEKAAMRQNPVFQWAEANGIIRVEIKCAKDFLKQRKLTYLGNWTMGTVTKLFDEKTEFLKRTQIERAQDDAEFIGSLPRSVQVTAAAWMKGIDVAQLVSRATFFRHAKVLREYGIDIAEPRNVAVVQPKMRQISVEAVSAPSWYSLQAA